MSDQLAVPTGDDLAKTIADLLATPANVEEIDIDVADFSATAGGALPRGTPPPRVLLDDNYVWKPSGANKPRVPLQLCEFLAYKTALAYETEARITKYLSACCMGLEPPLSSIPASLTGKQDWRTRKAMALHSRTRHSLFSAGHRGSSTGRSIEAMR